MLTDESIAALQATGKTTRHFDGLGRGLYLEVSPSGGKLWRFKYRFGGKEKRLAFGKYPDVSLMLARERSEAARQHLGAQRDPGVIIATAKANRNRKASAPKWTQNKKTFEEAVEAEVLRRLNAIQSALDGAWDNAKW